MADEVKIVLSPPPAEPFDVPTNPSPPPSEPFDVKVYPDPPPGGTSDVPTSPDGPPIAPHDVTTSPDGPPAVPFDVPTSPDGPSLAPVDVTTAPDGPPTAPFDVPTSPDSLPTDPFDVPTAPDGPPADPLNVPTTPDEPPADPFDVPTTPDPTIVIGTDGQALLPDGFDVPIFLNPQINEDPQGLLANVARTVAVFDKSLAAFLTELVDSKRVTNEAVALIEDKALTKIVHTSRDDKMIEFLSYAVRAAGGAVGGVTPNVVGLASTAVDVRLLGVGQRTENVYTSQRTFADGQDFAIDEMIDGAISGDGHPFTSPARDRAGSVQRFDASKYFDERESTGRQSAGDLAKTRIFTNDSVQSRNAALAASNFINGVVRVQVSSYEDIDGCVYSQTQNPSSIIDDDDARVPVSFTDLRKTSRGYRSVYVRPLNLGFSKSVAPEWSEGSAFGRVDPIVAYQRTTRSYSLSFDMQAFAPEDLEVMYRKMVWLDSMCYPSYGDDSLMRSGPVIRLRIGDVVSTDNGGLSGIIKSLNFDFNEVMWELKKGMKVPMSFKVSLEFLALHDGPVGRMNDDFGVFQLPPGQKKGAPGADTSQNGPPTEQRDGQPRTATLMPGRFVRFGDPRR